MSGRDVVVCGSRGWARPDLIGLRLGLLPRGTVVWHGACSTGADLHAAMHLVALRDRGIEMRTIPANWKRDGRQAGPIRNRRLLDEARPYLVLAFWDGSSPGTKDMIDEARRRRGIEVEVTKRTPTDPRQLPLQTSLLD